mmetsp:Transcript_9585/g.25628  ORF Transcript_9585/g.25628 Transcript_9585/m.25628 type:complete len:267 (+) Transcript_9585:94-894(+)
MSEGGVLVEQVVPVAVPVSVPVTVPEKRYDCAKSVVTDANVNAKVAATVASDLEVCLQAARRDAVCVLDWDDTLFPTSCLNALGVDFRGAHPPAAEIAQQLNALQTLVVAFLETATKFGAVMIVTNGERGWVEHSSSIFLPKVYAFLVSKGIKIVSARTNYEHEAPQDPAHWKIRAFMAEMAPVLESTCARVNFLSFGDGISELAASHRLRLELPTSSIKTIKFLEFPTIDQLARQVYMVAYSFEELFMHPHSVDLSLAALTAMSA